MPKERKGVPYIYGENARMKSAIFTRFTTESMTFKEFLNHCHAEGLLDRLKLYRCGILGIEESIWEDDQVATVVRVQENSMEVLWGVFVFESADELFVRTHIQAVFGPNTHILGTFPKSSM